MAHAQRRTQGRQETARLLGVVRRTRFSLLLGTALQASSMLLLAVPARAQPAVNALPTGGVVTAGSAAIGASGHAETITQSTQRAAINWQSFNVGAQQTVDFVQPSASAVALNRVIGPNPSQIAGRIDANGQLILINQSGVIFYNGAQVNSAGLIVSAAGMSDANFMAGKLVFDRAAKPNAAVVNQGTLTVRQAGLAALVAPQVANSGVIQAKLGQVVLAGAKTATLDLYGDGLLSLDVSNEVTQVPVAPGGAPVTALVTNTGVIRANGGTVQLTARAADGLVQNLVEAGGKIAANSVGSKTGTIVLGGLGGSIVLSGVVMADGTAPGSLGGQVQVDASEGVALAAGAKVKASGAAGGGTVAIGTTLARAAGGPGTASKLTAKTVQVAQGASIAADATTKGNGGHVTVLSSQSTSMAGAITAKGGPQGGNGGFVEVSGGVLALTGLVNTSAPLGATGTLLLDPSDLWVSDTEPTGSVTVGYTVVTANLPTIGPGQAPNGSTVSWVTPALLENQDSNISLAATNNLYVATSNGTSNTINLGYDTLALAAGNNLTIDRGFSIIAGGLSLSATGGAITLGGSSGVTAGLITLNQLNALGPTSLQVVEGGSGVTMNAGTRIALADAVLGSIASPIGSLDLSTGSGGVSQAAAGSIVASALTSSGGLNGNVTLIGTNNNIATAGNLVDSGGDITLVDNTGNLVLLGPISGNNLFFEVAQAGGTLTAGLLLSQAGGSAQLSAAAGGRISLVADNIHETTGSSITAAGGTAELAPYSAINTSLLGSSGLALDAPLLSIINTGTLVVGGFTNVPAGATAPGASASSISLDGALDLSAVESTLTLLASGPITEPTGPLTVGTLTGSGGTVTLGNVGNDITSLGRFTATSGAFSLTDGGNPGVLTVTGPVTSPGAVTLRTGGTGAIDATGDIGAGAGATLQLASGSGGITLNGGAALTGGTVALNGGGGGITLAGASVLGAPGEVVGLTTGTGGNVSESGTARIVAATLQSDGVGGAVALGNSNAVDAIGNFAVNGSGNGFQLVDTGNLGVSGPLTAPGDIALSTAGTGAVTATGNIGAGAGATLSLASGSGGITVSGGAALTGGTVVLIGGNGGIALAGDAALTGATVALNSGAGDITLGGASVVGAPGAVVDLNTGTGGNVSESGTARIVAATLQSNAGVGGAVSLGNSNAVGAIGNFAVNGSGNGFQLNDGTDLLVSAVLDATNIELRAPVSMISLGNGATIVTGGTMPARPGPLISAELPQFGAPGAYIEAANFTQIGSTTLSGQGGGPATLQIDVTRGAQFDPPLGLQANNGWLILDLGAGSAAGNVYVNALNVTYDGSGGANLFGTIDGITGRVAAASGFIQPSVSGLYLFNGCPIGAAACLGVTPPPQQPETPVLGSLYPFLPGMLPPLIGLPSLVVLALPLSPAPADELTDPDVVPPNVSYVDY